MVLPPKIQSFLRGRLGLALFGLAGVVATLSLTIFLHRLETASAIQEFERRQNLRHDFLRQTFGEYENSLFALRLVIENSDTLMPEEFERAARDIQARSPGIVVVQWAPILSADRLSAFVARMGERIPGFSVRERVSDGVFAPVETSAPPRDEFAVISYVYPLAGNQSTLGYDIFTAPTAPELRSARRSLTIALTRPLHLIQGFDGVILTCLARRPLDVPAP